MIPAWNSSFQIASNSPRHWKSFIKKPFQQRFKINHQRYSKDKLKPEQRQTCLLRRQPHYRTEPELPVEAAEAEAGFDQSSEASSSWKSCCRVSCVSSSIILKLWLKTPRNIINLLKICQKTTGQKKFRGTLLVRGRVYVWLHKYITMTDYWS